MPYTEVIELTHQAGAHVDTGSPLLRSHLRSGQMLIDVIGHRLRHLVIVARSRRTEKRMDILGRGTELNHLLDRFTNDSVAGAGPPRVYRSGDTRMIVGKQDGNAIGNEYYQRETRRGRDDGVGGRDRLSLWFVDDGDRVGVKPVSYTHLTLPTT